MKESTEAGEEGKSRLKGSTEAGEEGKPRMKGSTEAGEEGKSRMKGSTEAGEEGKPRMKGSTEAGEEGKPRIKGSTKAEEEGKPRMKGSTEAGVDHLIMEVHVLIFLVFSSWSFIPRQSSLRCISQLLRVRNLGQVDHCIGVQCGQQLVRLREFVQVHHAGRYGCIERVSIHKTRAGSAQPSGPLKSANQRYFHSAQPTAGPSLLLLLLYYRAVVKTPLLAGLLTC
jgi:hypothetical protein